MDAVAEKKIRRGRPQGSRNKRSMHFELSKTCQMNASFAIQRLLRIASNPNDLRSATAACGIILAYGYGKPRERVEITGTLRLEQEMVQAAAMIKAHMLSIISGGGAVHDITPAHGNGLAIPNGQLDQPTENGATRPS
jgi:hypothetical protein